MRLASSVLFTFNSIAIHLHRAPKSDFELTSIEREERKELQITQTNQCVKYDSSRHKVIAVTYGACLWVLFSRYKSERAEGERKLSRRKIILLQIKGRNFCLLLISSSNSSPLYYATREIKSAKSRPASIMLASDTKEIFQFIDRVKENGALLGAIHHCCLLIEYCCAKWTNL